MDTVPPARARLSTIRHRTAGRARRTAEQQSKVASLDVGKCRRGVGEWRETEMARVKRQRGIDVVHHVANADQIRIHTHTVARRARFPNTPRGPLTRPACPVTL